MAIARIACRAQVGLAAPPVEVEVYLGNGLPSFSIVGLAATEVKESKERVRAALAHAGFEWPAGRITVNLAPADLPKDGGRFDLAIAVGILAASGQVAQAAPSRLAAHEFLGELGLAGELRPVRGTLLAARAAAAAGAHSLLMIGPPGCGKSMLAQRLPPLLPPLEDAEALEVAAVASVAGWSVATGAAGHGASVAPGTMPAWPVPRPFRAPHHTASAGAIIGGGPRARPGEITLAHLGVLFLDEFPEFDRRVLEALREPLESGVVSISRAGLQAEYPARFQLVAAMNPCPCGHHGDHARPCRCRPRDLARYRARLSGPLLDRIDLRVALETVSEVDLAAYRQALDGGASLPRQPAEHDRAQICRARARQQARQGCLNAVLAGKLLEHCAQPTRAALQTLALAREKLGLSLRGTHRALRVARTLADLEDSEGVVEAQVAEAIQLRRGLGGED